MQSDITRAGKYIRAITAKMEEGITGITVEERGPNLYELTPNDYVEVAGSSKLIDLTILAIVHGVEIGGLGVVHRFLELLDAQVVTLGIRTVIGLGNPDAAMAGQRFLDRDLNRSFGKSYPGTAEGKRAEQIGGILKDTDFLLDLHQTKEKTKSPFFIFPFSQGGYSFARQVGPLVPIVTRWSGAFSVQGLCSDEYTNSCGGSGITLEMGQNGLHPYSVAIGLSAILNANQAILNRKKSRPPQARDLEFAEVFTFRDTLEYPKEGMVELVEGMQNFTRVSAGEQIGLLGESPVLAPSDGVVLFPQYYRGDGARPTELLRIVSSIEEVDFPEPVDENWWYQT